MKPCCRSSLLLTFAASLVLAACNNPAAQTPGLTPTLPAMPSPSATRLSITPQGVLPTPSQIPCDPNAADFCSGAGNFIFRLPIAPPGNDSLDRNYSYGSTEGGTREPHHGVEFENDLGTPVLAAADGTVYYAGNDTSRLFSPWDGFYGNLVVLEHPLSNSPFGRLYTLYAHLSRVEVNSKQAVRSGEVIGEVGLSGTALGSHLHFEVRVDPEDYYSTLNPELWLQPHPGNGSLMILITNQAGPVVQTAFNLQYFADRNRPVTTTFQVNAYASEAVNPQDPWKEVAGTGDRAAGWYRLTFFRNWVFYERWVEIQPGWMTVVSFTLK